MRYTFLLVGMLGSCLTVIATLTQEKAPGFIYRLIDVWPLPMWRSLLGLALLIAGCMGPSILGAVLSITYPF